MTHHVDMHKKFLSYEDCYYTKRGKFDDLEMSINALITQGCYSDLDRVAFMLIKPDAVVSGKAVKLIQRLRQSGFEIVHAEIHNQKRERNFEELYKFNLTKHNAANMLCAWWLARRVYTMGPSVDILLSHRNPDCRGQQFYKLLGDIKGVSNPYACDPTSLRGSFRACNRSLNLVHTSDSPLASVREFSIFRGVDALIQGIRRASGGGHSTSISAEIDSIFTRAERSLQWWTTGSKVSLSFATAVISARLLTSCGWSSTNLSTVTRLLDLYGEIAVIDDTQPNPSTAFNVLCNKLREAAKYFQLMKDEQNQEVISRLVSLCRPENCDHHVAEEVLATAANRGVTIDPWDSLALETSLFHVKDFSVSVKSLVNSDDIASEGLRVV